MHFDGAQGRDGNNKGVDLTFPSNKVLTLSYRLQFNWNNNLAKYEALLLGITTQKAENIKVLKVFGVSDLIVQQITN